MKLQSLLISFVLVAIFIFAMFGFAFTIQNDNNAQNNLANDSRLSSLYVSMNSTLNQAGVEARNQDYNFNNETIKESTFAIVVQSVVGVGRSFSSFTIGIFSTLRDTISSTLGIPGPILSGITFIIIVLFIFALYAWWRNPN
jgi:mannose/fructose/N-acetylgalactosamine-specific phosphotransferase system component IID